jgi:hypothetical protein
MTNNSLLMHYKHKTAHSVETTILTIPSDLDARV